MVGCGKDNREFCRRGKETTGFQFNRSGSDGKKAVDQHDDRWEREERYCIGKVRAR